MSPRIAVLGMACVYPDAGSPEALFENALAGRRAFRRIPPERLRLADYRPSGPEDADGITAREAALIEGWTFDRLAYRVAARTFESADLAHWLALDVAARALADARSPSGEGFPRESTGVIVGNTLTGESSRASSLRLRWPFARRVVDAALADEGWTEDRRDSFLAAVEGRFKAPFPPPGDETLAGGLSNTIAGRVCNHFDFGGGGFTVDGACSASLLAVAQACSALEAGDLDVALAGGVDVSLDPFELVGFARVGAIATGDMRIYDAAPTGFLPGEGCGFVVLMREEEARRRGLRPRAVIRGWGISSDGSGGLTRPEARGQTLALDRAYRRAGFGIGTVPLFEGHGTGTAVGDRVELESLGALLKGPDRPERPAAIGSIKANIGHTKAAAGIAGFLKAARSVEAGILPPVTGCERPHPLLLDAASPLAVLRRGDEWPAGAARRAGVTALGFGGINVHVVVEAAPDAASAGSAAVPGACLRSAQDAELVVIGAPDRRSFQERVRDLLRVAGGLARAEVADLARVQAEGLGSRGVRGAVVASTPERLEEGLARLDAWLEAGVAARSDAAAGVFLGAGGDAARLVFLFPGQAAPARLDGGSWRRRFPAAEALYAAAGLPSAGDGIATEIAQPAIVTASLAALRVLRELGIEAGAAIGHSLGELTALCWAGVLDEEAALRIARSRGRAMARSAAGPGAMAQIGADEADVAALLAGSGAVIAGHNSSRATVVSGPDAGVRQVIARAAERGFDAALLRVSHAFHSPLVAPAAEALRTALESEAFRPPRRLVVSTITGKPLPEGEDLRRRLVEQVTSPVRFLEAFERVRAETDLFIEAGPGSVLRGFCAAGTAAPVLALDAGGDSLRGLLLAAGAAFALGAPVEPARLFRDRFTRPFDPARTPAFFRNPCEAAPALREPTWTAPEPAPPAPREERPVADGTAGLGDVIGILRRLVAEKAQLPVDAVLPGTRLLEDFHLNSITVGALVGAAARELGTAPPVAPTEFARSSVEEIARALLDMLRTGAAHPPSSSSEPPGLDSWVGTFEVDLVESPPPPAAVERPPRLLVLGPAEHPLVGPLRLALGAGDAPEGVAVCLPAGAVDDRIPPLLLRASRALLALPRPAVFLVVQDGGGGGAFAKSLHLETGIAVRVVDAPSGDPRAAGWIAREVSAAGGFSEAVFDAKGRRRVPLFRERSLRATRTAPLGPGDVLLVTGGGKGIAAECALRLGAETGARLLLVGRSLPETDPGLRRNLERFAARGLSFRYLAADVLDAAALRDSVGRALAESGPVTAVLHGAGINDPCPVRDLDEAGIRAALAPKIDGLRHVLAAVDPGRLRLLIGFSSIIARTGLPGEAAYGLANELFTRELQRFASSHPCCRVLPVEWSVWSGTGMGERLGRIEALARQGIAAMTPDQGVEALVGLAGADPGTDAVVVTGRLGRLPTAGFAAPELPVHRFLEKPLVHYPGQELVVEIAVSTGTDLYLEDHRLGGEAVLPAVVGLEALAAVAGALAGSDRIPVFEQVEIPAPVVVPDGTARTLRILAVRRGPDAVDAAIRSDESGFQVDHLRARCRFDAAPVGAAGGIGDGIGSGSGRPSDPHEPAARELLSLDPATQVYGSILFHRGRFARVKGYVSLGARSCIAVLGPPAGLPWYSPFLPRALGLGDPSARDAAIHAIQACIPHATVLPVGAEAWETGDLPAEGELRIAARERSDGGDTLIWDVVVTRAGGAVLERIRGLALKVVARRAPDPEWPPALWACYLERRAADLSPEGGVRVAVEKASSGGPPAGDDVARRLAGPDARLRRRPDGRPELAAPPGLGFSASRADGMLLAVAGPGTVACDVEIVAERSDEAWAALLGAEQHRLARFVAGSRGEPVAAAATRLWTAAECLKKAGRPAGAPMTVEKVEPDGWVVLASGPHRLVSFVGPAGGHPRGVAFCILSGSHGAAL